MAGALAISESEAVREAALGFAFSPDPAVSSAALVAVSQQGRASLVSSKAIDRLLQPHDQFPEEWNPVVLYPTEAKKVDGLPAEIPDAPLHPVAAGT
jgi:hypothetical protein